MILLLSVESRRPSLRINFDIEGLLTKLGHGAIVDDFHMLASGLDTRRALLKSFEIKHCHLLDVHVGLVARNACSTLVPLRAEFVVGLVMKVKLVKLLLVKVGQVPNGAQCSVGRNV